MNVFLWLATLVQIFTLKDEKLSTSYSCHVIAHASVNAPLYINGIDISVPCKFFQNILQDYRMNDLQAQFNLTKGRLHSLKECIYIQWYCM
jgi:hypothetical protein